MRLVLLALWPAAAVAHAADSASASSSAAGSLAQVTLGLLVVLGLMAASAWLLRRFNAAKGVSATHVKIIGGVSVGSRERIVVIEIAELWIVVGVAPGRVNALSTMPRQELTGVTTVPAVTALTDVTAAAPAKNFSTWLAQIIEKRNGQ